MAPQEVSSRVGSEHSNIAVTKEVRTSLAENYYVCKQPLGDLVVYEGHTLDQFPLLYFNRHLAIKKLGIYF